jgi:hypothetical protein
MSGPLPGTGRVALQALLEQARLPTWRLWARDPAIEKKDILKARGYAWSPRRVWATEMLVSRCVGPDKAAEVSWLRRNVMGSDQAVWGLRITARDRYSDRLGARTHVALLRTLAFRVGRRVRISFAPAANLVRTGEFISFGCRAPPKSNHQTGDPVMASAEFSRPGPAVSNPPSSSSQSVSAVSPEAESESPVLWRRSATGLVSVHARGGFSVGSAA